MADSIQLISIFIGSPSGLEEERRAARAIVEELNRDHSRHWGCMLELVGWEETLPGHGRPQELINKDLDRCEYFIGILYDHWGSPTATGDSRYSSGFEEEFERAKSRLNTGEMKNMVVYFKELPTERKRDPGPSLSRVIKFRDECFERKDALYADFADLAGFESLVRARLNGIGWDECKKRSATRASSQKAEQPEKQKSSTRSGNDKTEPLLTASIGSFFNEMTQRSSEWEETSVTDVARLRLIGLSLSRPGNDDSVLGNHDANILFLDRDKIDFSSTEMNALVKCGVAGFEHQNVPLWHWLSLQLKNDRRLVRLRITAVIGKEYTQANAIRLLMLLNQEPPDTGAATDRQSAIRSWMKEGTNSGVFKAANVYLQQHGRTEDIATLEGYYGESVSQRKNDIGQTIIAIEAKLGEAHALNQALQMGIDELNSDLCRQLFSKPSSLTTEALTRCLNSDSSSIRRHAISILNERKETEPFVADRFGLM